MAQSEIAIIKTESTNRRIDRALTGRPTEIASRYEVLRCLGRGGSGVVYLVADRFRDGELVALKTLDGAERGALPKSRKDRLVKEFRLLHQLRHPGIVAVQEYGVCPEAGEYFTMEYVPWPTLEQTSGDLSVQGIIDLLYDLAAILSFAHNHSIVHYDLKPNNIFVRGGDESDSSAGESAANLIKVCDFGMAGPPLKGDVQQYGTFIYSAPEMFGARRPDSRADLYSLGMIGYVLLTGSAPFDPDSPVPLTAQKRHYLPDWKSWNSSRVAPELATLLTRCLNPDPAFRPRDIGEVLAGLARFTSRPTDGHVDLTSAPFVGRGREMRVLVDKLGEVKLQQQWAVLVAGESQVGKSRLMDEFAVAEQLGGTRVVRMQGNDLGPLLHHLVAATGEGIDSQRDQISLTADDAPRIFRLLDEYMGSGNLDHLVICWHRADAAGEVALKGLKSLLLHNPQLPILWVLEVTREPEELKTLAWRDHLGRTRLEPLGDKCIAELVGRILGKAMGFEALAQSLTAQVGRNPGHIALGLRQLALKGQLVYKGGQWHIVRTDIAGVTGDISPAFQIDLSHLSPPARSAAEWLAVLNEPCEVANFVALMEFTPEAWSDVIAQTTTAGIMHVSGGRVRFQLPIVRENVYRAIPAGQLAQLHQLAGRYLEENGSRDDPAHLAACAIHYLTAGDRRAVVRLLDRIIELWKQGVRSAVALELLQEAVRLPDNYFGAESRFRLRMMLADTLSQKKRYKEAAKEYTSILGDRGLMRFADPAPLLLKLGQCQALIPDLDGAGENLRRAYHLLKEKDPEAAVRALNSLSYAYYQSGDPKRSGDALDRSLRLIDNIRDLGRRIENLNSCCRLLILHRRYDEALSYLDRIIATSQTPWDSEIVTRANLVSAEIMIERAEWQAALGRLEMMEKSLALGNYEEFQWRLSYLRHIVLIGQGQVETGLASAVKIIPLVKVKSRSEDYCRTISNIIRVQYFSGQYWQGMLRIREAMGVARRAHLVRYQAILESWAVAYRSMEGKQSLKLAKHAEGLMNLARHPLSNCIGGTLLAEYYLRVGDLLSARRVLSKASDSSAATDPEMPREIIELLEAICQARADMPASAKPDFNGWETRGAIIRHPYSLGTYYGFLFQLACLAGDRDRMQEYHQRSLSIFRRMAAHAMVARSLGEFSAACRSNGDFIGARVNGAQSDRLYQSLGLAGSGGERPSVAASQIDQIEEEPMAGETPRPIRELSQIIEMLNTMEAPEKLTQRVLEVAREAVGAERGLIIFTREKASGLSARAAIRIGAIEEETISRSIAESVLKKREAVFSDNALLDERWSSLESVRLANIRTVACLPIMSQGEAVGVLYLDFGGLSARLDDSDRSYLMTLANLIGVMLAQSEQMRSLKDGIRSLRKEVDRLDGYGEIKGRSRAMREVFDRLALLKGQDLPVLILGETGTGKELVARTIHRESGRAAAHFFALNCAAFPDTLVESMLFGHIKGAFSGANSDHVGIFEQADHGTVFLDEVDTMTPAMQAKLLRVLQEGEFIRVGEARVRNCDVRIIAAAKPGLLESAASGVFREDLFYRLNVIQMPLPPLRERAEDLPILIEYFLQKACDSGKRTIPGLERQAEAALLRYHWPGNVRQLENAINQAIILTESNDKVRLKSLPIEVIRGRSRGAKSPTTRATVQKQAEAVHLRETLERCGGDREMMCQTLNVSRSTLYRRLKKYHLH